MANRVCVCGVRVCVLHMLVPRACALGRNGSAWGSGEAPTVFANGMSMGSAPTFGADSPPPTTSMLIFEAPEVSRSSPSRSSRQGRPRTYEGGNRGQVHPPSLVYGKVPRSET